MFFCQPKVFQCPVCRLQPFRFVYIKLTRLILISRNILCGVVHVGVTLCTVQKPIALYPCSCDLVALALYKSSTASGCQKQKVKHTRAHYFSTGDSFHSQWRTKAYTVKKFDTFHKPFDSCWPLKALCVVDSARSNGAQMNRQKWRPRVICHRHTRGTADLRYQMKCSESWQQTRKTHDIFLQLQHVDFVASSQSLHGACAREKCHLAP